MKIVREGKEIELTSEELASAHAEFVTNFMRKTLEEDFDVAPEDSQQLAEQAYDRYCEGNAKRNMNVSKRYILKAERMKKS